MDLHDLACDPEPRWYEWAAIGIAQMVPGFFALLIGAAICVDFVVWGDLLRSVVYVR